MTNTMSCSLSYKTQFMSYSGRGRVHFYICDIYNIPNMPVQTKSQAKKGPKVPHKMNMLSKARVEYLKKQKAKSDCCREDIPNKSGQIPLIIL